MTKPSIPVQPFPHEHNNKPAVLLVSFDEQDEFLDKAKGGVGHIEMYATEPVGTEVWVRYEVNHYGNDQYAKWQCLARVTATEELRPSTPHTFSYHRTTLELIADPEDNRRDW